MNQNHISWIGNSGLNPTAPQSAVPAITMTSPSPMALPSAPPPPDYLQPRYPVETARDMQRNFTGRTDMTAPEPDMMPMTMQGPPPLSNRHYIPGYLTTVIGKNVRAEFSIGSGSMMDKAGILREVGVNYFVLEDYISHALIMCDLYSAKFVTIM